MNLPLVIKEPLWNRAIGIVLIFSLSYVFIDTFIYVILLNILLISIYLIFFSFWKFTFYQDYFEERKHLIANTKKVKYSDIRYVHFYYAFYAREWIGNTVIVYYFENYKKRKSAINNLGGELTTLYYLFRDNKIKMEIDDDIRPYIEKHK
ncbi:MAG: hypothetical protein POELPBGB_00445 [Bacteroidia bacterium]|nr:hypothetical protein [Bacteroidia bacterium]